MTTKALQLQSHQTPYHIETVTLQVHDLHKVSRFYQDIMGLALLSSDESTHTLGCDDQILLRLVSNPEAVLRSPRAPGLFHTAFLLPERSDLGQWLHHAIASGTQIDGMSDHGVSEAIYLADPEGNGIEIYVDRPRHAWRSVDGAVQMGNARMDIQGLLATPKLSSAERFCLAGGSRIGHVHLDVPDLAQADAFFRDVWGMDRTFAMQGAHFYSNGGYHHHIAANIWNARDGEIQTGDVLGLSHVALRAKDPQSRQALVARWETSPDGNSDKPDEVVAPWGLRFSLS